MYHPYFRGKQFELIAIREMAGILSRSKSVPIIEPVKEALSGLERTIKVVTEAGAKAVLIANPQHGDHSEDNIRISTLLRDGLIPRENISLGILLREGMTLDKVSDLCGERTGDRITFVHAGFTEAKALAGYLGDHFEFTRHVFFEKFCGKLYRKHFAGSERVLLRDGFEKRRNADYPPVEPFSDLHITYPDEGMDGFGDFLIVGDDYSEGGGPAYAVAIHLTFIDPRKDNAMYIYHFVSTSRDTPTDPAGKFAQALDKLMERLASGRSFLVETSAIKEFRQLHARGHFPGLGYIKKLSMKHHVETLANFMD